MVGVILAGVVDVNVVRFSASMSQFILSEYVSIAAAGNRKSLVFRVASDVFGLLEDLPLFFFFAFAPFLGHRSCSYLSILSL